MKKYLCLFVFVLVLSGCGVNQSDVSEPERGYSNPSVNVSPTAAETVDMDYPLQNYCNFSFYCGTYESETYIVTIPLVINSEIDTVDYCRDSWNFGSSSLDHYECKQVRYENGFLIWNLELVFDKPTVACEMNSVDLLLDGEQITYQFGTLSCIPNTYAIASVNDNLISYLGASTEYFDDTLYFLLHFNGECKLNRLEFSADFLKVEDNSAYQDFLGDHLTGARVEKTLNLTNSLENSEHTCISTEVSTIYQTDDGTEFASLCPWDITNNYSEILDCLINNLSDTVKSNVITVDQNLETVPLSDWCDLSVYINNGDNRTIWIPVVVRRDIVSVDFVESSWDFGESSVLSYDCYYCGAYRDYSLWGIRICITCPIEPCELDSIQIKTSDGFVRDYYFGTLRAVVPDFDHIRFAGTLYQTGMGNIISKDETLYFIGIGIDAKQIRNDGLILKNVETSAETLELDKESLEEYLADYSTADNLSVNLKFNGAENKYYQFDYAFMYQMDGADDEFGQIYWMPLRNNDETVYENLLEEKIYTK